MYGAFCCFLAGRINKKCNVKILDRCKVSKVRILSSVIKREKRHYGIVVASSSTVTALTDIKNLLFVGARQMADTPDGEHPDMRKV